MRYSALILVTYFFLSGGALAATFTPVEQQRFGEWEASLYQNVNTREFFCAAETRAQNGTDLRINFYRSGSAFLEFYNNSWDLLKGDTRFSLRFNSGYSVNFRGKSWGDSYTHDFTDRKMIYALLGLLAKDTEVTLLNANGAPLADFSLTGSAAALRELNRCVGGI